MTDDVMVDPPRENIDGEKIVHHRFDHGVDWEVNVSHVLLALVVLALAVIYLKGGEGSGDDDDGGAPNPGGFDE